MMNPTIKEFHKYLDKSWLETKGRLVPSAGKASVAHRPPAEPRPECLFGAWVQKRPLSPGACAFHGSPLRPSRYTN